MIATIIIINQGLEMHRLSYKQGLSWSHGALFYIVMICLHLASAAEPVNPPTPPKDNEDISALC